jgi:hypothetical protein
MIKKSVKKLTLHKESLRCLDQDQLRVAVAGITAATPCLSDGTHCTACTCRTCYC